MANPFIKLTVRPVMELTAKAALALAQSSWLNGDPAIVTRILLHGLIHGETYDLDVYYTLNEFGSE